MELFGLSEFAEALGLQLNTFSQLRRRHPAMYPDPIQKLKCGPIWTREQVMTYLADEDAKKRETRERLGL